MWLVADAPNIASFIDADTVRATAKGAREAVIDNYEGMRRPVVYLRHRALKEYDCAGQRSRSRRSVRYQPSGTVESSSDRATEWRPVQPGTLDARWMRFVCAPAGSRKEIALQIKEDDIIYWASSVIYPTGR